MRLSVEKAFAVLLLLLVAYLVGGIGLLAWGKLDRLYFFPGWSLKGPHGGDKSTVAADGPVVFYRQGKLLSKQLVADRGQLVIQTDTLQTTDTVMCHVGENGRQFRVALRDTAAACVPAAEWGAPSKLLALSDIEGNFKGLEQLLRGAGVVDEHLAWRFGTGHLVLVGDFFDRGLQVTESLWLIYKLEGEAARAGGQVHFIMGNHERMNLMGQFKYLRRKYRRNADTLGVPYQNWYGRRTVLGHWLRTKNVAERIGPALFVHGGLSPALATRGWLLQQLNALSRRSLDAPTSSLTEAEKQATQPPSSPDWYRGLALGEPTAAEVARVLRTYGATAMVLGHTPAAAIETRYQGKIITIDMPHQERTDQGLPLQALWWSADTFGVVDSRGQHRALAAALE